MRNNGKKLYVYLVWFKTKNGRYGHEEPTASYEDANDMMTQAKSLGCEVKLQMLSYAAPQEWVKEATND